MERIESLYDDNKRYSHMISPGQFSTRKRAVRTVRASRVEALETDDRSFPALAHVRIIKHRILSVTDLFSRISYGVR